MLCISLKVSVFLYSLSITTQLLQDISQFLFLFFQTGYFQLILKHAKVSSKELKSLLFVIQLYLNAKLAFFNSGNGPDLLFIQFCCGFDPDTFILYLCVIRSFCKCNCCQFLQDPVLGDLCTLMPILNRLLNRFCNLIIS